MPARDLPLQSPDPPVTRSRLVADLLGLGVDRGGVLMVHASMSRLGWVVGGSQTVVEALLEAVGPHGTLMAHAGWEDNPFHLAEWPESWQRAYLEEMPPFDPAKSEARREYGRLPERIRTWPGSWRSSHPLGSFVALGARARDITADQPPEDPYGRGSPLGKLVEADGQVLLLGAPLNTMTLIHHAEAMARTVDKRHVSYRLPVDEAEGVRWREFHHLDTSDGATLSYEALTGSDQVGFIAGELEAAAIGAQAKVANAGSHLLSARGFTRFATDWFERRGPRPGSSPERRAHPSSAA